MAEVCIDSIVNKDRLS